MSHIISLIKIEGGAGRSTIAANLAPDYRPKYTAVICSRSCPNSRLIVSRAARSI
jgi:hypothetical protein